MEQIPLDKKNDKKLQKKVKRIKEKIISGNLQVSDGKEKIKDRSRKFKERGVIYIGRIPHGFYENELRSYFNQFGIVTRVKLVRSKRTGRSKGYGFVEFLKCDVAKIAAEAMNNYLMFNCLLKCRYIPPEEQHRGMFVRTIQEHDYPRKKNRAAAMLSKNRVLSKEEEDLNKTKSEKKIEEFKKFFEERGIEFNFKINDPDKTMGDDKTALNSKTMEESDSDISYESECEDQTDDEYGILEIDESDDEIHFKTPPQVKKVIKRYSSHNSNYKINLHGGEEGLVKVKEMVKMPLLKKSSSSTFPLTGDSKFSNGQQNMKEWTVTSLPKEKSKLLHIKKSHKKEIQKLQKKNFSRDNSKLKKTVNTKKKRNSQINNLKDGITDIHEKKKSKKGLRKYSKKNKTLGASDNLKVDKHSSSSNRSAKNISPLNSKNVKKLEMIEHKKENIKEKVMLKKQKKNNSKAKNAVKELNLKNSKISAKKKIPSKKTFNSI